MPRILALSIFISKIKSMSLSCPEVTRQVLFSADALTLRFSTINQYDYFKASEIVTEERLANRACAALAMNQQENIEENLWAINQFLQSYQAGNDVNKIKMAEIDGLRDALISAMAAGGAVNELQAVDPDTALVKVLLACLGHFMTQLPDIRGKKRSLIMRIRHWLISPRRILNRNGEIPGLNRHGPFSYSTRRYCVITFFIVFIMTNWRWGMNCRWPLHLI